VVVNIRYDPTVYPNPMEFIPERYLGEGAWQKDPSHTAFEFCRFISPGINTAYSSIFIEIAVTVSVSNIWTKIEASSNLRSTAQMAQWPSQTFQI